jgi:hypothetical protein
MFSDWFHLLSHAQLIVYCDYSFLYSLFDIFCQLVDKLSTHIQHGGVFGVVAFCVFPFAHACLHCTTRVSTMHCMFMRVPPLCIRIFPAFSDSQWCTTMKRWYKIGRDHSSLWRGQNRAGAAWEVRGLTYARVIITLHNIAHMTQKFLLVSHRYLFLCVVETGGD